MIHQYGFSLVSLSYNNINLKLETRNEKLAFEMTRMSKKFKKRVEKVEKKLVVWKKCFDVPIYSHL